MTKSSDEQKSARARKNGGRGSGMREDSFILS
jgi:hypothetical protein